MIGGFLGDFVKGQLSDQYQPGIISGIRLHRAIDVYTDQHPIVKRSHSHFNQEFRRFAPIICDIVYDHFLASQWPTYSNDSLEVFSEHCYETVLNAKIPEKARNTLKRMQNHNALASYANEEFIKQALISVSGRLKRDNPLSRGFSSYEEIREPLNKDFGAFMPELIGFVEAWRVTHFSAE